MNVSSKYYFLSTDLFAFVRVYVFATLLLVAIFVLTSTDISLAPILTSLFATLKLVSDFGYIQVNNFSEILIRKFFRKTYIDNIDPYHYWWNYDFQMKLNSDEKSNTPKWESRSNKVIVNLTLKNKDQRIQFKETITLDTRHPNDAIYLDKIKHEDTIIPVQRVDKLMLFLKENYVKGQFKIAEEFDKK